MRRPLARQAGEVKWVYKDDQGALQGPFSVAEINGWFTVGYLQGDHMVRKDGDESGEFVPLSTVPELSAAAAPPAVDPNAYAMQAQMMQQPTVPAAVDPSQISIPEGKRRVC
eukprot:COSAG02_NODE_63_length_43286_cov_54.666412_16_plen_112_part_00